MKPVSVLLKDSSGKEEYKVDYTYSNNRISSVTEYGFDENNVEVKGQQADYRYSIAAKRTTVTTTEQADDDQPENIITAVYTFNDYDSIISQYAYTTDSEKGTIGEGSGVNPYGVGGSTDVVSNINNLLLNHNFETLYDWNRMPCNDHCCSISATGQSNALFGTSALQMSINCGGGEENGIYQMTDALPEGSYSFSVYVRPYRISKDTTNIANPGAYIRVTTANGKLLGESERIFTTHNEFVRLVVPFELESKQPVKVSILMDGELSMYVDGAQLENCAYANAYNMLVNGNFEKSICHGWTNNTVDARIVTDTKFNMSSSLRLTGNLDALRYAAQKVIVKTSKNIRETFTLSGWAKANSIPQHARDYAQDALFRLRARITYGDGKTEDFAAFFAPCTDEWQFASVQVVKQQFKEVRNITVYCEYGFNTGYAYFDDIQLVRNNYETGLTSADFTVSSDGATGGTTNVSQFEEAKDRYGNLLTETTFADGEFGTMYRSFKYNDDDPDTIADDAGNNMIRITDERGNDTVFEVDRDTSQNMRITDRNGVTTEYQYDDDGKMKKTSVKNDHGDELSSVSYQYDVFDQLAEITRGDNLKYSFAYNAFHVMDHVKLDCAETPLYQFGYKKGTSKVKSILYANGDKLNVTYTSFGQPMVEKWYNSSNNLVIHNKYVYDRAGNLVRSIDLFALKEYNYYYSMGNVCRATESDITIDENDMVVGRKLINTIFYTYDTKKQLVKKRMLGADGSDFTHYYTNSQNETPVTSFTIKGQKIISHSKNDSFGRKVFDELQLGTGFVSRQFTYHTGEVTKEHKEHKKLKSSPTTKLIKSISFADGRTISYEYDKEERITQIVDKVDETATNTYAYTYDELGQLTSETVNGQTVNVTYDHYGNILTKGSDTFTYSNTAWRDQLTAINGQPITYDAGGNPLSYRGYTFEWEKGRQLKRVSSNTFEAYYEYNASGFRTHKTVHGVKHAYCLEGSKILKETYGDHTLIPLYDNADSVCGLLYDNTPYYFNKNQQGDILSIVDENASQVARYSYDAWGVCRIDSDTSGVGIADVNPFRYRGYYYDTETGFYYLESRYYDPGTGRFLNADEIMYLGAGNAVLGYNIYAYCVNNPINNIDPTGHCSSNCPGDSNCPPCGGGDPDPDPEPKPDPDPDPTPDPDPKPDPTPDPNPKPNPNPGGGITGGGGSSGGHGSSGSFAKPYGIRPDGSLFVNLNDVKDESWVAGFFSNFVSYVDTEKKKLWEFDKAGIKVHIDGYVKFNSNVNSLFTVSEDSLSLNFGSGFISAGKDGLGLTVTVSKFLATAQGFVKVNLLTLSFGMDVSQGITIKNNKFSIGIRLTCEVSMFYIYGISLALAIASIFIPALVKFLEGFAKAIVMLAKNKAALTAVVSLIMSVMKACVPVAQKAY